MNGFWRVMHYAAFVAWLGGSFASMVASGLLRRMDRGLWGVVIDVQAAVYRALIGPGAIITLGTGIVLSLRMYSGSVTVPGPWLGLMQLAGAAGALIVLLGAMPLSARLARLDPAIASLQFDSLRRRLAIVSSIAGTLGLVALIAGALYRAA